MVPAGFVRRGALFGLALEGCEEQVPLDRLFSGAPEDLVDRHLSSTDVLRQRVRLDYNI